MSAITAKASRKMKKYAVLTREPRCFLGSFDFSWEQRKFSDVVATRRGLTYKPSDIRKNGVRVLRSSNIAEDSFVLSDEDVFVVREAVNIDCVRANDILITAANGSSRLVGKHTIISGIPEESAVHGGFMLLGTTKEPHFVNASMGSSWYRRFIELFVAGGNGAIGNLNKNDLDNQDIAIPSEKEQKKIGSFFRQLDNLITLHQRKCVFLFGFFQAFISMIFTASTFSWEQRKLGEIGSVSMCRRIFKEQTSETGDIPFYKIGTFGADPDAFISRELFEEYKSKYPYPQKGDILISASGSIGRAVEFAGNNEYFQDSNIVWLNHDERLSNPFLKCFYSVVKWAGIEGSTIKRLYNDNILNTVICMPSVPEQKRIGLFFENLDNLITLHQRECISFTARAGRRILTANKKRNTSSWEQRKLSEIADKVTEKNAGLQYVETFTNSAEFGIISQRDFFDHDIAKLGSLDGYYIVKNEDFVYNPRISTSAPVGPINRNKLGRTGVMSPLYTVFRPHDVDTTYLEHFFKCAYWHSFMNFNGDSGARSDRFSIKDDVFFQMPIPLPYIDEQRKIGELLTRLDHLITLHQRKPFLMKWRNSDANRNQTNRFVL